MLKYINLADLISNGNAFFSFSVDFFLYHWQDFLQTCLHFMYMSNNTGFSWEGGTAYPSWTSRFTLSFRWVRVAHRCSSLCCVKVFLSSSRAMLLVSLSFPFFIAPSVFSNFCIMFVAIEKPIHDVCVLPLTEQVSEEKNTIGTYRNAD